MNKGDYVVTPREEFFKMVHELVELRREVKKGCPMCAEHLKAVGDQMLAMAFLVKHCPDNAPCRICQNSKITSGAAACAKCKHHDKFVYDSTVVPEDWS